MKTVPIVSWKTWKNLCEYFDEDPYETKEFGIDEEGGRSTNFEYVGDTPKKEEVEK